MVFSKGQDMAIVGFIVLGDKTSHGGKVIECTSNRSIHGLKVARVGDIVWCPRCKRPTRILTSRFPQVKDNGVPCAFDMDVTDCGALLYSRHNDHAGYGSKSASANGARPARAASRDSNDSASAQEHFVLRAGDTGKELAGVKYTLTAGDGRVIQGETDEHGRTGVVWTDTPADTRLTLDSPGGADDDPYHYSGISTEDI